MHLLGTEWLWDQGGVWVWGRELGEDIETSVYTQKQNSLKKKNFRAAEVETVHVAWSPGFYRVEKGELWGKSQRVECVDLLTGSFHGYDQPSQLSCPDLLSSPETFRPLTF